MIRSTVIRRSFNPLSRRTWLYGFYKLRACRFQLADRVNARSGWLARWMRWPLGLGRPAGWNEVHVARFGGIGDSLLSTPALHLFKQLRPQTRIVFYTPHVDAFRGLSFLDEVRPLTEYPYPSAIGSLRTPRVMWYLNVVSGYRHGAVEFLYEGSVPPRRHIARIFGDQLGLDLHDVRPFCVFDSALVRHYQEAWADLPRPWVVVNRTAKNSTNKNWMSEHWDRLIDGLLERATVVEIGEGPQGGIPPQHAHYVDVTGSLPLPNFLAVLAAGDIHVGPISGPVHVAAAAGTPSVVIYGGYEHPECSGYPGNIDLYTPLPCSPCWLLMDPCPIDRVCLRRITPERVMEAVATLAGAAASSTGTAPEVLPAR